ncbi:hypothetical protein L596_011930 [Steinernema carpocapsae]|uniref:Nuclear receptor domain-containing protein n=1 Tax=Steinernema carpocapsae TaxID=34508 RepID=A0A4U5NWE4_STECR|nr:hypothetical protein L596_011930 [Steinernema carpocapsae]
MATLSTSAAANSSQDSIAICQICGATAHGLHFQVVACRACAAFFRRSAEAINRYKCRRVTEDCDMTKSNCRFCRLKKCKAEGMTLDELRFRRPQKQDQDSRSPSSHPTLDDPVQDVVEVSLQNSAEQSINLQRTALTVIDSITKPFIAIDQVESSPLQTLLDSFRRILPLPNKETIKISNSVDYQSHCLFCKQQMKRVADWVMTCREFAQLPTNDKCVMFENFWLSVHSFERCSQSVEVFGENGAIAMYMVTETVAAELPELEYEMPDVEAEQLKKLNEHFRKVNKFSFEQFVEPMKELNLADFEVVYLCFYKMWYVKKVSGLSPKTHKIADCLLEAASAEMHEFYVREFRTNNYAQRIIKLFELLEGLERTFAYCGRRTDDTETSKSQVGIPLLP